MSTLAQSLLQPLPHGFGAARQRGAAGDQHAREAAAVQAILVVHRRLVNQIRERALRLRRDCGRTAARWSRITASVR